MKKYIGLVITLVICIVLDCLTIKGIWSEPVPEHRREFLYQSFTGSLFDWFGLLVFNLMWLVTAWLCIKEYPIYTNSPRGSTALFGVVAVICLLLIRFL